MRYMIRFFQIIGIVMGMHILGTAILIGYVSGPLAMLASPLLGIFGWFFVLPEAIGVGLQWAIYHPYPESNSWKTLICAIVSALVGGIVVALFIPKEQGNEGTFLIAGALAGAGASIFSFLCIHFIKTTKHRLTDSIQKLSQ